MDAFSRRGHNVAAIRYYPRADISLLATSVIPDPDSIDSTQSSEVHHLTDLMALLCLLGQPFARILVSSHRAERVAERFGKNIIVKFILIDYPVSEPQYSVFTGMNLRIAYLGNKGRESAVVGLSRWMKRGRPGSCRFIGFRVLQREHCHMLATAK